MECRHQSMDNNNPDELFVLSIFPSTRGFGFALFQGVGTPFDWGFRHVQGNKNAKSLEKVRFLIHRFNPNVLLLEDCRGAGSNRASRIEQLIDNIEHLAKENQITVTKYSRSQIQVSFAQFQAKTKYDIATVISRLLPEFHPQLPPPRKIWLSEDYRMGIFDAVSLIFTHFYFLAIKPNTKEK